jgi:hypothetical protein
VPQVCAGTSIPALALATVIVPPDEVTSLQCIIVKHARHGVRIPIAIGRAGNRASMRWKQGERLAESRKSRCMRAVAIDANARASAALCCLG